MESDAVWVFTKYQKFTFKVRACESAIIGITSTPWKEKLVDYVWTLGDKKNTQSKLVARASPGSPMIDKVPGVLNCRYSHVYSHLNMDLMSGFWQSEQRRNLRCFSA